MEQALALFRRKQIYEARWPETRAGYGPGRGHTEKKRHDVVSFSADAATKTGKAPRSVQRQTKIGHALKDVAEEVAATSIADNQKELLALSKLAPTERKQVLRTLKTGKATSVKQAVKQHVSAALTPLAWIITNQLGRRNLTPSQKGPLGLELEKQLAAEAKKRLRLSNTSKAIVPDSEKGHARDKAAEMVGVSSRYVQEAKQIEQEAPEVFEQVKHGKLNIPQAKKIAALPAEDRPAAIARIHTKAPVEEGGYIYRDGKLVAVHELRRPTMRPRSADSAQARLQLDPTAAMR